MGTDQLTNVPADNVGNQVQQLVYSDGVTVIKCELQNDGKWTITAVSIE